MLLLFLKVPKKPEKMAKIGFDFLGFYAYNTIYTDFEG